MGLSGPLIRAPLLRIGNEIRWHFAVSHASQSHVAAVAAAGLWDAPFSRYSDTKL